MFEDFKKVTQKDWLEKATKDLKGVSPLEKFSWEKGALKFKPYYDASDTIELSYAQKFTNRLGLDADPSGEPRYWSNIQKVPVLDEKQANKKALNALENGADGIQFETNSKSINYELLLNEIATEYCELSFKLSDAQAINDTFHYLKENHTKAKLITLYANQTDETNLINHLNNTDNHIKTLVIAGKDSGGPVDEVCSILDKANKKIRSLIIKGVNPKKIIDSIFITSSIGTDFFIEIAKIRAIRMLFFQLAQAYQYSEFQPEDLHILCVSKVWVNEKYGPHENMLKSSTSAFSAILGGCNALIVEPENENDLEVRIARNVSSVLKDEAYLAKVVDPVAGSYYLENVIDDLAKKSWDLFKHNVELNNEGN